MPWPAPRGARTASARVCLSGQLQLACAYPEGIRPAEGRQLKGISLVSAGPSASVSGMAAAVVAVAGARLSLAEPGSLI